MVDMKLEKMSNLKKLIEEIVFAGINHQNNENSNPNSNSSSTLSLNSRSTEI
jgi:hypothetical protein